MGELVVGLDIGTSKVRPVLGEVREADTVIVGVGMQAARGMKNGIVSDSAALAAATREKQRRRRPIRVGSGAPPPLGSTGP